MYDVFQRIKDASGSNAKLDIAKNEFTSLHHNFFEVCFNSEVYGISISGISKAVDYDKKRDGRFEDIAEFVESLNNEEFVKRFGDFSKKYNSLNNIVQALKNSSGNEQIQLLREYLQGKTKPEIIWILRAIQKNMRCGINLTSYNKIRIAHDLQPITPRGVQLCGRKKIDELQDIWYPAFVEYKYDGERCEVNIRREKDIVVTLISRGNKDITSSYPEIVDFLKKVFKSSTSQYIFDGEIVSKDFNTLQKRMQRKESNLESVDNDLKIVIFDILEENGSNLRVLPFASRRSKLVQLGSLYKFHISYGQWVEDHVVAGAFYHAARECGQEGVVIKHADMKWVPHSRDGWFKVVPIETLDLEIVDAYHGTGKNANLINGVFVKNKAGTILARVSSGIKDTERELLTKLYMENKLFGRIVEVKYRELTPPQDGVSSLRFPVFLRLRDDKFESD